MYIEPNSEILILKNVPLNNNYQDTIYFSSKSAQENYFKSKAKFTENNQTYQRVQKGVVRVGRKAENLYDCNYIMFRNTSFGDKWFYGFITSVEYVNNGMSMLNFEIDVLQTWMFDFELRECWVERQHTSTDVAGEHTVPESVDTGDYVTGLEFGTDYFNSYSVVIGYVQAEGSGSISGTYISGQYSGVLYEIMPCNSVEEAVAISTFLSNFTDTGTNDNVVCVLYVPTAFVSDSANPISFTVSGGARPTTLDGYTPRNKKLLSFPFTALYVHNGDGNSALLQYEQFSDPENTQFKISSYMGTAPEIICTPNNYKNETLALDDKIGISNFPQCAYAIDSYRAWLAMNSGQQTLDAAKNFATRDISTIAFGAWQNMVNATKAAIQPDHAKGVQSGNAMVSNRLLNFYFAQKTIKKEYAKIIDDYFDRYGYAIERNLVPHTHTRPHWNYVKTRGCNAVGSVPADDMSKICSIHDAGITYWMDGSEVGNYSLDNSV